MSKNIGKAMIAKYGKDYYSKIGAKGGRAGRGVGYNGGFAAVAENGYPIGRERARIAGAKGGFVSKRKPRKDADEHTE